MLVILPDSIGMHASAASKDDPFRVMVVDDSAVVRGLVTRMLEEDETIVVVASVGNGQAAVNSLDRHEVEVVILDIEMPVMDGLTALPLMLKKDPKLKIIMASTLTTKNAEISLMALEAGAHEYVPKPSSSRELSGGADFKHDLLSKVKCLGDVRRAGAAPRAATHVSRASASPATSALSLTSPASLRKFSKDKPDIIVIGSSTGGPQALFKVLKGIASGGGVTQPILITQHMPATFTTILAQHISRQSGIPAKEAEDGEVIEGGHIYLAPGDFHMVLEQKGASRVLSLNQDAPVNYCRPAVDPMFRSVSSVFASRVLAIILTGMGSDGCKGAGVIADGGGTVVVQDEATSVVWGMPGAAAQAGVCSAILPIDQIAPRIIKLAKEGA